MVHTVIALDEDDKRWLDHEAAAEGVPVAEIIRRAVRLLRGQTPAMHLSLDDLLEKTRGLWKRGDGLEYQRNSRRAW